ncbi:MAG TPA: Mur ligase family protein [Terricaulis sp.]|nr:Mur ligase family protein [Terricaulis sp.]
MDRAQETFNRLFGPEFGHGKAFDLARLRDALTALGNPQRKMPPVIHVAGTNGKGSTIAFMRAIAEAAWLDVHAFTKPHLFQLRERFLVAGEMATDEALGAAAARVHAVAPELTQFDAQVAAAFLLFSETPADLALLEAGMGGRDDSTNVIEAPAVSVITPIGLDHQEALGATLAEIAVHKAGIIKPGVPVVIARQEEAARAVLEAEAARVGAPMLRQGVEWDAYLSAGNLVVQTETRVLDLPSPTLQGAHQVDNAGLACAAMMCWRPLRDSPFGVGVAWADWPARLEPLTRGALSAPIRAAGGEVWVDGGHNAHAGAALARALQEMKARRGGTNIAIVGLRARKDAGAFAAALRAGADHIIAVPLSEAHAPLEAISPLQAHSLAAAMQNAAQFPAPRVLICGSFLLAAQALTAEGA